MSRWTYIFVFAFLAAIILTCAAGALLLAPSMKLAAEGDDFGAAFTRRWTRKFDARLLAAEASSQLAPAVAAPQFERRLQEIAEEIGSVRHFTGNVKGFVAKNERLPGAPSTMFYRAKLAGTQGSADLELGLVWKGEKFEIASIGLVPQGRGRPETPLAAGPDLASPAVEN